MKASLELTLEYDDVARIDKSLMPMPVFAFNPCSLFTTGVAARTKGDWSHFMWMIEPGVFASQGLYFQTKHIEDYRQYILKFIYSPGWTQGQRELLITSLRRELAKPWWQTRYDFLALLGQLVGMKWIQSGQFEICSDSADHLKLVDGKYDLKDPTPSDVNLWMKSHRWDETTKYGYLVYGRYFGRD